MMVLAKTRGRWQASQEPLCQCAHVLHLHTHRQNNTSGTIFQIAVQSNSSMHCCECVVLCISLQRPILHQISSLMHPKIQQSQVIVNVLHPGCARPPRWSLPVLWRRFEDGLASICVLIHPCKMPSETTGLNDGWKWWLVGNTTDVGCKGMKSKSVISR